jgi:hypothetical protein
MSEAKVVNIQSKCVLESENEFTKVFRYRGITMFMHKANDDENGKFYVSACIERIDELQVQNLNYPIELPTESERDAFFSDFDNVNASELIDNIIEFIKEQQEKNKEDGVKS